ncbi:SURF-family protein [Diaporthe amygdali]|uniref:SURF-family protein n=1 Tax=Phomopsis amygdali TaxID=1214568 RepID=UPI0022FE51CF|nr:SURF-family protein [Diaporthe amygdali]KAJ0123180.1 SURF-family protein [Diaporthe amygdali]
MKAFTRLARPSQALHTLRKTLDSSPRAPRTTPSSAPNPPSRRPFSQSTRRSDRPQPADDPNFTSILDNPPNLVRAGRRHGPGLIILAIIPLTAFALGSWQVQRLQWKTDLIAKCEDRLFRDPLPLPPRVDPVAVAEDFDYRRVYCSGTLRHDQEMLIGPRMRDGEQGFMVITPLERADGSTVLVNRGWIPKRLQNQRARSRDSLPMGEVTVEGLLRKPWKKNMFTPENRPDKGEFYFPDVKQMAELTGAQPVWIEATMDPNYMQLMEYEQKGIPIGRPAEVNLRNNHAQYIFTWYSLSLATSIMLWMVIRKPPSDIAKRVRMNKHW